MEEAAVRRATTDVRLEAATPATAVAAADIAMIQVFAVFLPVKITALIRILIVLMRHRNVAAAVRQRSSVIIALLFRDGLNADALKIRQTSVHFFRKKLQCKDFA